MSTGTTCDIVRFLGGGFCSREWDLSRLWKQIYCGVSRAFKRRSGIVTSIWKTRSFPRNCSRPKWCNPKCAYLLTTIQALFPVIKSGSKNDITTMIYWYSAQMKVRMKDDLHSRWMRILSRKRKIAKCQYNLNGIMSKYVKNQQILEYHRQRWLVLEGTRNRG